MSNSSVTKAIEVQAYEAMRASAHRFLELITLALKCDDAREAAFELDDQFLAQDFEHAKRELLEHARTTAQLQVEQLGAA